MASKNEMIELLMNQAGVVEFENALHSHRCEFQTDESLARELYDALCNVVWKHEGGFNMSYSWRSAGSIVSQLRSNNENYLDFYCSGTEGVVSDRIKHLLGRHGWRPYIEPETA